MSTATVAAGNVRPLSAIKADYASRLAGQPQSILADAKAALTWLPSKAYNAAVRALRWLHVPNVLAFARRNFARFIGVVGKGAFAVEVLTSPWGQKTITTGLKFASKVLNAVTKLTWKVLTSPLRLFTPTRSLVERVDNAVAKVNSKLTPDSGETFGPLQITRDIAGYYVSAQRTHMKLARTTAVAVMAVRITRRLTPVGWMRIAAYILDGLIISRSYGEVLDKTWLGRKLARQTAVIEADVLRQEETVVAEATHFTREAAADTAQKLRAEADQIEAEGISAAGDLRDDMVAKSVAKAQEMRHEAESLEATAARLAAAETAIKVTEAAQEATTTTVVDDRPKPGPSVPPMGGRTPSSGPATQPHQRHGGKGKNR